MDHASRQTSAWSNDTSPEAETLQIMIWRALSSVERAQLITGASRAVRNLAIAGLRDRHPGVSPDDLIARFAFLTFGPALAAPSIRIPRPRESTAACDGRARASIASI